MLQFITLLGRYTGMDKRGLIVGGTHLLPGNEPKKLRVDEATFLNLLKGVENGWFEIKEDNYEKFVISRFRTFTPVAKETPATEEVAEEATEEATEEVAKTPTKKKSSRKKTAKTEE